jgi:hypothetical protein
VGKINVFYSVPSVLNEFALLEVNGFEERRQQRLVVGMANLEESISVMPITLCQLRPLCPVAQAREPQGSLTPDKRHAEIVYRLSHALYEKGRISDSTHSSVGQPTFIA